MPDYKLDPQAPLDVSMLIDLWEPIHKITVAHNILDTYNGAKEYERGYNQWEIRQEAFGLRIRDVRKDHQETEYFVPWVQIINIEYRREHA